MALQRTTEGKSSGTHSMTREQAEPLAIRLLQDDFDQHPPRAQSETLDRVAALLAAETKRGQLQPSALKRYVRAGAYGVAKKDLSQ